MRRPLALLVLPAVVAALLVAPADRTVLAQQSAPAVEVRIARDHYGVPHVYSDTQEGVAWGAGYAITVDRLFQMDVLRALSKGYASELLGGVAFAESDLTARTLFYTDDERREKVTRLPLQLQRLYAAYVDGVNTRIDEVNSNPSQLPQEYVTLGIGRPEPWDVTDSVAIADMLVETFGAGGGSELDQAELLKALLARQDTTPDEAVARFTDVRWVNDPAAPVSIPEDYDWKSQPSLAEGLPAKEWRRDARIGLDDRDRRPGAEAPAEAVAGGPQIGTLEQASLVPDAPSEASQQQLDVFTRGLETLRTYVHFGSNAFITGPTRTASGGTVQLGGPQVGQFAPQIIAEFGLHTTDGSWDMTGLTFAGSGPAVLIGRTPFFAWTTTTGNSDGGDVYVERLGPEPETYVYEGRIERMDCRDEAINEKGGAPQPAQRICRTRHGPVISTDEANGVAYSLRRSWFDAETGTTEGFFGANFVDSIEDFSTSINKLQSNHNMFYVDAAGNYGYWHPGAIPFRADGTDVRLPQDGRFASTEWQRMRTAQEMPHAVNFDRAWLANWNNKPAVDWNNGDGANYGAVFRNAIWNELLAAEPEMSRVKGEDFNKINSTIETEFGFFRDHIVGAGRASDDEQVRAAAEALATWDARRIDEQPDDGLVDSEPGYSLWKGWRQLAREMAFSDDLGAEALGEDFSGRSSDSMLLHVLEGVDASLPKSTDYLNGTPVDQFLNDVMRANLDALATEYGTADMSQWKAEMPTQFYTRLNSRFLDCTVTTAVGLPLTGCDDNLPGNVRDLEYMNRGTYNHLVEFVPDLLEESLPEADGPIVERVVFSQADPPGPGEPPMTGAFIYSVEAESIISPGQSGYISPTGQEDPHYDDQHELYASFRYKPMPTDEEDVVALGGAEPSAQDYEFSTDDLVRYAGADRVGTAVAASSASFPEATTVVIASGDGFADALAAAPLAVSAGGPVLLTRGGTLDERVAGEIERLGATTALVVGGPAAVPTSVEDALRALEIEVRRISGSDRYATAAAIASEVVGDEGAPDGRAFVVNGQSFADALAVGAVAGFLRAPILLVEQDGVPEATRTALEAAGASAPVIVGGEAAVSARVEGELAGATRVAGGDRYSTAVEVAEFGLDNGMAAGTVVVATGRDFPDGLSAGPIAGAAGIPLVLVEGGDPAAADVSYGLLGRLATTIRALQVFGGPAAVSQGASDRALLAASER